MVRAGLEPGQRLGCAPVADRDRDIRTLEDARRRVILRIDDLVPAEAGGRTLVGVPAECRPGPVPGPDGETAELPDLPGPDRPDRARRDRLASGVEGHGPVGVRPSGFDARVEGARPPADRRGGAVQGPRSAVRWIAGRDRRRRVPEGGVATEPGALVPAPVDHDAAVARGHGEAQPGQPSRCRRRRGVRRPLGAGDRPRGRVGRCGRGGARGRRRRGGRSRGRLHGAGRLDRLGRRRGRSEVDPVEHSELEPERPVAAGVVDEPRIGELGGVDRADGKVRGGPAVDDEGRRPALPDGRPKLGPDQTDRVLEPEQADPVAAVRGRAAVKVEGRPERLPGDRAGDDDEGAAVRQGDSLVGPPGEELDPGPARGQVDQADVGASVETGEARPQHQRRPATRSDPDLIVGEQRRPTAEGRRHPIADEGGAHGLRRPGVEGGRQELSRDRPEDGHDEHGRNREDRPAPAGDELRRPAPAPSGNRPRRAGSGRSRWRGRRSRLVSGLRRACVAGHQLRPQGGRERRIETIAPRRQPFGPDVRTGRSQLALELGQLVGIRIGRGVERDGLVGRAEDRWPSPASLVRPHRWPPARGPAAAPAARGGP